MIRPERLPVSRLLEEPNALELFIMLKKWDSILHSRANLDVRSSFFFQFLFSLADGADLRICDNRMRNRLSIAEWSDQVGYFTSETHASGKTILDSL